MPTDQGRFTPEQILAARKRLGLTQAKFAALLGYTQPEAYLNVIRWEKGRGRMHPVTERRLRELLEAKDREEALAINPG